MLGMPVLAGAAAYAIAEARVWRGTLEDRPRLAKKFLEKTLWVKGRADA
jgi:hypothetical protein